MGVQFVRKWAHTSARLLIKSQTRHRWPWTETPDNSPPNTPLRPSSAETRLGIRRRQLRMSLKVLTKAPAIRRVPGVGDNDQSIHPPVRGGTTRSLGTRQTIRGAPCGRWITERQMSICAASPTSVVGPASPGCRPTIDVGGVPGDLRCRAARARAAKIPAAFKLPVRLRTPCIPAGFVRMQ